MRADRPHLGPDRTTLLRLIAAGVFALTTTACKAETTPSTPNPQPQTTQKDCELSPAMRTLFTQRQIEDLEEQCRTGRVVATATPIPRPPIPQPAAPKPVEKKIIGPIVLWNGTIEEVRVRSQLGNLYGSQLPPLLATDNALYVNGHNHQLAKINFSDGQPAWPQPWENAGSPIAAFGDTVWVIREGGERLYVLSQKTGEQIKRIDFKSALLNLPVQLGNAFFFVSQTEASQNSMPVINHSLTKLDLASGQIDTASEVFRSGSGTQLRLQAINNRFAVITFSGFGTYGQIAAIVDHRTGQVYKPDAMDASNSYGHITENGILIRMLQRGGGAIVSQSLSALDVVTNREVWKDPKVFSWPPLWTQDNLLLMGLASPARTQVKNLIAIHPQTGETIWENDEIELNSVLDVTPTAIFVKANKSIFALSRSDGTKRLWRYDFNGRSLAAGIMGTTLVIGEEENLTIIDIANGNVRNRIKLNFVPNKLVVKDKFVVAQGDKRAALVVIP